MEVEYTSSTEYIIPRTGFEHNQHGLTGVLFAIGNNMFGQLGTPNPDNAIVNALDIPNVPAAKNVKSVLAGEYFSAFISNVNNLYTAGLNNHGELGRNGNNTQFAPVMYNNQPLEIVKAAAGNAHMLTLTSDNRVIGFGDNSLGQLGPNIAQTSNISPTQIANNVIDIDANENHSAFLFQNELVMSNGSSIPVMNGRKIVIGSNYGLLLTNAGLILFDLNNVNKNKFVWQPRHNTETITEMTIGENRFAISTERPTTLLLREYKSYIYDINANKSSEIPYAIKMAFKDDDDALYIVSVNGEVLEYNYNQNKYYNRTNIFYGPIQDLSFGLNHTLAVQFENR